MELFAALRNYVGAVSSGALSDKEKFDVDIRAVAHQTSLVKGAVDLLKKQQEGDCKGFGKGWNVLERKAVANMKMLGRDKAGFRTWHEKLVNIMEQIKPGSRGIIKALVRHVDNEEAYIYEWLQKQPEYNELAVAAEERRQIIKNK